MVGFSASNKASVSPASMAFEQISVDPETYQVRVDGQIATCEPARRLPLSQAYYIV